MVAIGVAVGPMTGAVVAGARTVDQGRSIAAMVRQTVDPVLYIVDRVVMVTCGRKTSERIVVSISKENLEALIAPTVWQVSMGGMGAIMPEQFRWIGPIIRNGMRDPIGRRGMNERDATDLLHDMTARNRVESDVAEWRHRSLRFLPLYYLKKIEDGRDIG